MNKKLIRKMLTAAGGNLFSGNKGYSSRMTTTGGAGYVPPAINVSKTKQSINKRLYRTISPLEASYSLLPAVQSFLSNKEYDDTIDGINEEYPVGTIDAIWAKYLQVPEKDRRYSDRLEKSSYRPSKGSNSDNYYKLPLQDYEKESLVNTTRELPLYNNKVSKLFNNYALGEHTVGRGYDNHGEYASYFDVFDINPFNGKYSGINMPIVNKLDDIGIGKPVRIYDRIYLDDYYGVKEPTHATYLPEVIVIGKKKQGGKINIIKLFKNGGFIRKMQTAAGGPIKKFRTKDVNGNWVYMDISTGRTTSAAPESGTIRTNTVNSIGGDVKTKLGRTRIALNQVTSYNNRQYKVHNYADTRTRLQLKNQDVVLDKQGEPEIVQADYTPTLEAPMKIVSPEFDLLTLGRLAVTSAYNAAKPTINVMADTAPEVKSATTLSLEQIEKAFNQARQWHLNRINSPGYRDRALRAGFTEEEIPELLKLLTGLINRLKLLKPEDVLGSNIKLNNNSGEGALNASYWKVPTKDGRLVQGISFHNPNMSYDDAVSSFVHEFGHGATFGLNGTEEVGYKKMLADQFPLINRAVKYNKTLYPEVTEETVGKVFPYAAKVNKTAYFAEPTEIQSRGYEFMRDYVNSWWKLKNSGNLFTTLNVINTAKNNRFNSKLFGALTGDLGAYNFQKNALGISVPLGLGGYGLYNNDNYLQQLQYLKQGGKMNILEFLKNGSGIHIKKKNRGKFTSYCGGKVTDECILKGKNSSNPAIRKRATFAANARKWKHLEGGTIINQSPIVASYLDWLLRLPGIRLELQQRRYQEKMLDLLQKQQQADTYTNIFSTLGNLGINYLSNHISKNNAPPSETNKQ